MNIITKQFNDINTAYLSGHFGKLEDILFLDIETTGFTAKTSSLYLIGCAYFDGLTFSCKQFFAEKPAEEPDILREFMKFAADYKLLIHFNGNNFDIPYLMDKCEKYEISCGLTEMTGIDLYKRISPYRNFLKLPNCKQKTLEQYLRIDRRDVYSGKDLINVYHDYVSLFNVDSLTKLLIHNEEDIRGMINIVPMLAYIDIFYEKLKVTKVSMDTYLDQSGQTQTELVMKLKLPSHLPMDVTHMSEGCYFNGSDDEGILKVPVYTGELKYFYANYKDYYYLPEEDEALHKSVARFVDAQHRTQATAANCYTRVTSIFLRRFNSDFLPVFKFDYQSKELFIEITKERKVDREFFSTYASSVLNFINKFN